VNLLPRILVLLATLLLVSCTDWSKPKRATQAVTLYEDVELTEKGIIPAGSICQIDENLSVGKIYAFHKIKCADGQSGYIFRGGMQGRDENAFQPTNKASILQD
jgi:hypothetical protein